MASFHFFNGDAKNEKFSEMLHYSQAVRVGNQIKCSGQCGFTEQGELSDDTAEQVRLAVENVDKTIRAAGARGWEDVYAVRSYHVDVDASFFTLVQTLKQRMPHRPVWTVVPVPRLGMAAMQIEIEVEALIST